MRPKTIYERNGNIGRPFWWRLRHPTKGQRFRKVEELKREVCLEEEKESILKVLNNSFGRNILLFLSISDIRKFKGNKLFFSFFRKGFLEGCQGSFLALKVCTKIEEVEALFELVTSFPQYLELGGIQFGDLFFSSFFEWFSYIEKNFSWKLRSHLGWMVRKKQEELLILFFLTMIFYENFLYTLYLYFVRWLQ